MQLNKGKEIYITTELITGVHREMRKRKRMRRKEDTIYTGLERQGKKDPLVGSVRWREWRR